MRSKYLVTVLAAMALIMAACGGDDAAETTAAPDTTAAATQETSAPEPTTAPADAVAQRDLSFVVVSHGQSSDPFWSVAANGVKAAEEDMGVSVVYQAPGTFDMAEMAQIIDAAVASQPDGLVVTIPDADALGPSIRAAVDAGIPVISMNSGSDVFADLGVLVHVGQTEYEAGLIAGQEMGAMGVGNALCINQEVGNAALDARCQGFSDGLGGDVEVIPVDLADPTGAQAAIEGALSSRSPDGVLALGPTGAIPALNAMENLGMLGQVELATFDLGPEVLEAIGAGDMAFAIDQYQYAQGYLPIVLLTMFHETGGLPLGSVDRVVLTGPQLVTSENAADVISYSEEGLR